MKTLNPPAVLYAASIEVCCPHCGEPQPSPGNGSDLWLPAEIAKAQGPRTCVACDEPFQLFTQKTAMVQS